MPHPRESMNRFPRRYLRAIPPSLIVFTSSAIFPWKGLPLGRSHFTSAHRINKGDDQLDVPCQRQATQAES